MELDLKIDNEVELISAARMDVDEKQTDPRQEEQKDEELKVDKQKEEEQKDEDQNPQEQRAEEQKDEDQNGEKQKDGDHRDEELKTEEQKAVEQSGEGQNGEQNGDRQKDEDHRDEEQISEEDEVEHVVEKILDKKIEKGCAMYLVKWEGYPSSSNTWEPLENLVDCDKVMQKYEEMRALRLANKYGDQRISSHKETNNNHKLRHKEHKLDSILGLTVVENEKYFLISLKDNDQSTFIRASLANKMFPDKVIAFYLQHLQWKKV